MSSQKIKVDSKSLQKLLKLYKQDKISLKKVLTFISQLPYKKLKHSIIDLHRGLRKGIPEIVYCEGKTLTQLVDILNELYNYHNFVIGTRLDKSKYDMIKHKLPQSHTYYETARIIHIGKNVKRKVGNILILTAGTSDIPVAEEAAVLCELLGNRVRRIYDIGVAGIHRINEVFPYINKAKVIIVVAGMDGVLPSVIGGIAKSPVIAVPTSVGYGANFKGLSALLTMLNSCAAGVVVVNIDNGFSAGYVANLINKI